MSRLFAEISTQLEAGQNVMLVGIIAGSGSTPRGAGAKMAVYEKGFTGTIGGGAIEFEAQNLAREALGKGESFVKEFSLAPGKAASLGMICGGDLVVYFQHIAATDADAVAFMAGLAQEEGKASESWLATRIAKNGKWAACLANSRREVVLQYGNIAEITPQLNALLSGKSVLLATGEVMFYGEPLVRAGFAYIFGGGHVSRQLVPVLNKVFFPCVVIDNLPAFLDAELFPDASELMQCEFDEAFHKLDITENDYIVIVTRGHQHDLTVLAAALKTPARYIGMIGSCRKIEATYDTLLQNGYKYSQMRRVCAPIGLNIGGETPEEIAISIAAEMISVRSGKNA